MTERINKLYRPAELQAAIVALQEASPALDEVEARATVVKLHALGYRIVKVD